jgi:hypothetical protein
MSDARSIRVFQAPNLDFARNDDDDARSTYIHMKNFWLVKQEPSSYSWSDFVAEGQTSWTGVRNYAARNNLRRMEKNDEVLFYHSGEDRQTTAPAGYASGNQKPFPSERHTAGPPVAFVGYAVGGVGISRDCEDGH